MLASTGAPERMHARHALGDAPPLTRLGTARACPIRSPVRHTIEAHLGIKAGETSKDGNFTLTEVECLGACVNAPMVQINDMFFENLTPENTITLLNNLKEGRPVKIG